ncbi:MAG TPA: 2-dehydropantoate 2-reductase [Sandaracinaceae bacterium]
MRVGVYGAGAIGAYVGAKLAAAGARVVLVAREELVRHASELELRDVRGASWRRRGEIAVTGDAGALRDADLCLVTVKSRDTAAAASVLAGVLGPGCAVISLQNGLGNARTLRDALGPREVAGGVVGFNVHRAGPARFVQATSGAIFVGPTSRSGELVRALRAAGEDAEVRADIEDVMAGKLLLNLNNGVCAATGLGIAASLRDRDARWVFSRCIEEGLRALRAAGLRPARVAPLGPRTIARLMALPDAVVHRLARVLIRVGEDARSSTLQDLERGRPTEIDELNGAIVELAERAGLAAPANRAVTDAVCELERAAVRGEALVHVSPRELRRRVESSAR